MDRVYFKRYVSWKKHFSEFKEDKPELSNKILTQRLKELEKNNIIERYSKKISPNTYIKLKLDSILP